MAGEEREECSYFSRWLNSWQRAITPQPSIFRTYWVFIFWRIILDGFNWNTYAFYKAVSVLRGKDFVYEWHTKVRRVVSAPAGRENISPVRWHMVIIKSRWPLAGFIIVFKFSTDGAPPYSLHLRFTTLAAF